VIGAFVLRRQVSSIASDARISFAQNACHT
jgi:hypothetical protein